MQVDFGKEGTMSGSGCQDFGYITPVAFSPIFPPHGFIEVLLLPETPLLSNFIHSKTWGKLLVEKPHSYSFNELGLFGGLARLMEIVFQPLNSFIGLPKQRSIGQDFNQG